MRYIGSKKREQGDSRDDMKAQYYTNLTFKYLPNKNDIEIKFGVKNITDKKIKTASSKGTIDDDLMNLRRNIFIGVNYRF